MTREKAIKILRKEIECLSHTKCEDCILEAVCDPIKTTPYDSEYIEAYGMAIKALEQEPCEDCISKQAVLELAKNECETAIIPYKRFVKSLNALSSVTSKPKTKTDQWIGYFDEEARCYVYECPICRNKQPFGTKYCWECGARLIEPQESDLGDYPDNQFDNMTGSMNL